MKKNKNIEEELENISPFLAKMKKEESFSLPENYFEQLETNVLKQCVPEANTASSETQENHKWLGASLGNFFERLFTPRVAFALASVVLLVAIGTFLAKPNTDNFADLSSEDALAYVMNNIDDFDEEIILSDLNNEDIYFSDAFHLSRDESLFYLEEAIDELDENLLEEYL